MQQQVRSPDYLFFEAEKKKQFLSGSEAVREAIRKANVDMAISYPITPQSESMHLVGDLFAEGFVKEYYRGENEFAVMSSVAGAAMAGVRVFTATGGPGTMRAFEVFPVWAGSRLPIVCAFLTRGINSPLTIQPDTIEMAFLLETGMLMLHAETAQDLHDMLLKAFVVAEMTDVHLPVGVFADGFFVTHTKEILHIPEADSKLPPYDPHCAPVPAMDMESVPVRQMRDPFVMKSNFISYAAHASWQQEIEAAQERSRNQARADPALSGQGQGRCRGRGRRRHRGHRPRHGDAVLVPARKDRDHHARQRGLRQHRRPGERHEQARDGHEHGPQG
jgi:pyruvate ferredoxin oxidoreductase alpha subunit